jgi:hypothetical protein
MKVACLVACVLAACHSPKSERTTTTNSSAAVPDAAAPAIASASASASVIQTLAPLAPEGGWFQTVTDDAGVPTYIAVPTGATTQRPIVVGLHGAQDRADWACSEWFGALGGRAFVVCPRGVPLAEGFAWSSVDQIASKSEAALALVRARWGAWISDGRALYGGWSQAATLGALVLEKRPDLFDAAVFVELGHTPLDAHVVALSIRKSGVRAAAIVCATGSCEAWATGAKPAMTGFPFAWYTAGHRGHVFDGEVAKRVYEAITFVEKDDARWAPLLE